MRDRTRIGIERAHVVGYLFGILTAACWGTSPVFIRKGLVGLPSPLWGVSVALGAAACVVLAWIVLVPSPKGPGHGAGGILLPPMKAAILFQVLAGVLAALGSVARTFAIEVIPVAVAVGLVQTTSLFTLVLAPLLLGRHVERVTTRLSIGAVLIVAGSILIVSSLAA